MGLTGRARKFGLSLATAGISAGLLGLPAGRALAAEHNWKMQTEWAGGPLMELGSKAFAERVKLLTDGRIEIQVFPAGTLAKASPTRSRSSRTVLFEWSTEAPPACNRSSARELITSIPRFSRMYIDASWIASTWSADRSASGAKRFSTRRGGSCGITAPVLE